MASTCTRTPVRTCTDVRMHVKAGFDSSPRQRGKVISAGSLARTRMRAPLAHRAGTPVPRVMNSVHLGGVESTALQIYRVFINCFAVTLSKINHTRLPPGDFLEFQAWLPSLNVAQAWPGQQDWRPGVGAVEAHG